MNEETFTINDISDKYYYKKIGVPTIQLKQEIENAIKEKFNETSNILDNFEWDKKVRKIIFICNVKKEFSFEKEFEDLEKGSFGSYEKVNYFGIRKNNDNDKLREQVEVLYYNNKDNFAIKIKTKQEDEVMLCKNQKEILLMKCIKILTKKK